MWVFLVSNLMFIVSIFVLLADDGVISTLKHVLYVKRRSQIQFRLVSTTTFFLKSMEDEFGKVSKNLFDKFCCYAPEWFLSDLIIFVNLSLIKSRPKFSFAIHVTAFIEFGVHEFRSIKLRWLVHTLSIIDEQYVSCSLQSCFFMWTEWFQWDAPHFVSARHRRVMWTKFHLRFAKGWRGARFQRRASCFHVNAP